MALALFSPCDEAKPWCLRCTDTGRKCDGYPPVPKPQRRTKTPDDNAAEPGALIRKSSSPTFELFEDDVERRSFAFFTDRTSPEISGHFPLDFWERLIPLATFYEPALKHATIALASLHERYGMADRSIWRPNNDIAEGGFALQQYNKAIRCLINPREGSRKPALDTSLVACVLFACFESLRGHHGSALSHIRSGTQIMTQMNDQERDSQQRLCVPLETLDVVFARLDQQQVQLLGTRPMKLPKSKPNTLPGFCPEVPALFHSLEEARNNLDYQWNLCISRAHDFEHVGRMQEGIELQEHQKAYEANRAYFRTILGKWMSAFQALLDSSVATMNSKSLQAAMLLKMDGKMLIMHLEVLDFQVLRDQIVQNQMCWDQVMPMFENLVEVSATIIDAQNTGDEKVPQRPSFQLDHSIIGPLFSVGHKCRDPVLRRKAISMLYSAPRQEGAWDSILTARVCERIMRLEEEGLGEVKCAADIPDWKRISEIDVTFDLQARRGEIKLSRLGSQYSTVRESVTEVLEW
ncbi:MAG: hypothetical protein Q9168_003464 [Polycauliona sp. 1 TL-2023]